MPSGKWLVLLGRLIQGLWTGGQQTIETAYIAECIDKDQNLNMIAELGASAVLGFVLGPIVALIGRFVNFNIGSFYVDEYTSCGYFQAIFTIIMFASTTLMFVEIPREWRRGLQDDDTEEEGEDASIETDSANDILKKNKYILYQDPSQIEFSKIDEDEKDILSKLRPNLVGVAASLLIFLIHFNGFAVQETITTPISTDITHKYTYTLDYPESFAYILFVISGCLSVLTFMALKRINDWLSDYTFVMISSIMGLVGYFILIDFTPGVIEPARFIVGFCIISITFPLGRGVTLAMYAKIIGKHKAGAYMGYMLAVGAISRIIGPFWSVQSLGVSPALTFGICALLFLVNIIVQWCSKESLRPHWSYYIEVYEEKLKAKAAGQESRVLNPTTPGSVNPLSPIPGNIVPKNRDFRQKSKSKIEP